MLKNIQPIIQNDVKRALKEDIGKGDVSAALLPKNMQATAAIITREPMIVAGIPWATEAFYQVCPTLKINWLVKDKDAVKKGAILAKISGNARAILTAERTALNFLQTLSAVATTTNLLVKKIAHTKAKLLDTRKTLPGLRIAQKYAVTCGGGFNHRFGLYDAYLLKENHILAIGSIASAIKFAEEKNANLLIEVEVETLDELKEALLAKPDRILLDNFSLPMMQKAVLLNKPKA